MVKYKKKQKNKTKNKRYLFNLQFLKKKFGLIVVTCIKFGPFA